MSHHWRQYSYFEKGCRKKGTRQSRKVLWMVFCSLFFKELSKNGTRGHERVFANAKGKQQKQVRQLQCQEQCIDHIPKHLSGLQRDNLSRNNCMLNNCSLVLYAAVLCVVTQHCTRSLFLPFCGEERYVTTERPGVKMNRNNFETV